MDPNNSKSSMAGNNGTSNSGTSSGDGASNAATSGTTGKYLVLMRQDAAESGIRALSEKAGLKNIANIADFAGGAMTRDQLKGTDAIVFDKLAVAVVDAPPDQIRSLGIATEADNAILAIEPERIVYALQEQRYSGMERSMLPPFAMPATSFSPTDLGAVSNNIPVEYLQGYRDAVNRIVDKVLISAGMPASVPNEIAEATIAAATWNESELTWGLQATKAAMSRFSGKGIRVAVLDTGFNMDHPDFMGRKITTQSFISNEEVQDGHGHGTHCIGTACGSLHPYRLPRYGIAYESEIFAGKVLSNEGSGADGGILAGINWAITNGCHIVSMSLGAPVRHGAPPSEIFEEVARRALEAGTLIIAAAGNESRRPFFKNSVDHPANCPSIMAVGALDKQLRVASFSNEGRNPNGGQVDIAAPGRDIISSWRQPELYESLDGTSMATPHVAGIAALLAEANPTMRGRSLASLLMQGARRLDWPARDVGAGLVQAP